MTYDRKDRFFHKAKAEGFAARSAYKLEEMQKRFKILRPGQLVVDLGAAPGAWSQVAQKCIGDSGVIVGIDLKPIEIQVPKARFFVMDAFEFDSTILPRPEVDVLLSDMAPNTTGVRQVDQARSLALCEQVLTLSETHLKAGGHLVMKIFEGHEAEEFGRKMKRHFGEFKRFKPEAVRKGSFETYLVGLRKR